MCHGINEAEAFDLVGNAIKRISHCVQERLDGRSCDGWREPTAPPLHLLGVVQSVAVFFLV